MCPKRAPLINSLTAENNPFKNTAGLEAVTLLAERV
ncbi:Hypothetical protein Bdt_1156 [Bdellovibrio bacteriovorus str. Tiberius]|uniref:Uncharacterized protein n=1 Tax=Bdellovibrio bacteriovorus str. Tiberius TaxID=1069642 RepID=K7YM48_BDEBC|nr:Hypothetical protein Bdt_1156 [Bdellovibrio bacteriovorus str. Tiberius]